MTPTAIYARYSSGLQNDRSIEDQFRYCEAYAHREGLIVTARYEDRAVSGSKWMERLGVQRLLRDAKAGLFTCLVIENADRLSRHAGDIHYLREALNFAGVTILQVTAGELDSVQASVSGLVSTVFLKGLADKTRRGLAGVVAQGRSAGGRAYGYRPVKGEPGQLEIVEHEARIIARIFTDYVAGQSPRQIAGRLNAAGVPAPRGPRWNASTLNGSQKRGNGILFNELYAGVIVWNKVRMVMDPESRRRISRPNPPSLWQRKDVPSLAIVDRATFERALQRRRTPIVTPYRRRKGLLSGLMKCPDCGGSLVMKDKHLGRMRLQCSTHKESGTCQNNRTLYADRIETAVTGAVASLINQPQLLQVYVGEYNRVRHGLDKEREASARTATQRLARVTADLDRIVDMLMAGTVSAETMRERIAGLEAEKRALAAEIAAAAPSAPARLYTGAVARFRAMLADIAATIAESDAMEDFRRLFTAITVHPDYRLEISGNLAPLLMGVFSGSENITAKDMNKKGEVMDNKMYQPQTPIEIIAPRSDAGVRAMIYGSVCSGIESATVAWHPLDWKAALQ